MVFVCKNHVNKTRQDSRDHGPHGPDPEAAEHKRQEQKQHDCHSKKIIHCVSLTFWNNYTPAPGSKQG